MRMRYGIWARWFLVVGCFCAFGCVLLTIDFLALLHELPSEWWAEPRVDPTGSEFDIRWMHVDFFFGWLGWWGYVINLLWLPAAAWKRYQASKSGGVPSRLERALMATNAMLPISISGLVHLTPLKFPSYNVWVL